MGAWVETVGVELLVGLAPSRPSWARGLKQLSVLADNIHFVAPLVGAWVETVMSDVNKASQSRAPRGRVG